VIQNVRIQQTLRDSKLAKQALPDPSPASKFHNLTSKLKINRKISDVA
jgi:hypothetical protein